MLVRSNFCGPDATGFELLGLVPNLLHARRRGTAGVCSLEVVGIRSQRVRDGARLALAGVRLANGAAATVIPGAYARRLGANPATPVVTYGLRLFGVRTLLIGYELLQPDRRARAHAVRVAPLIHAGDTAAALLAGASGVLPRRAARTAMIVSGTNLALSLIARPASD